LFYIHIITLYKFLIRLILEIRFNISLTNWTDVDVVVEALRYKPDGRVFGVL
jgi:hypothetical protein